MFPERAEWIVMKKVQGRKRLHLTNFDYKGSTHIYFVTVCTADRQSLFLDKKLAKVLEDEIEFRREKKEIKIFCYCIMPDHLHILLSLTDDYRKNLQDWVSSFKRYTAKIAKEEQNIKPLWQRNFFDRIVRTEESIPGFVQYILNNPVRKGIVANWEEYPFNKMLDSLPL